jgi:hypothetical protein
MVSQIPGKPIDVNASDLTAPSQDLLKGLNLLGDASPDAGVAVLESTATGISKWIGTIVAALGGTSAVIAAFGAFWTKQPQDVRITLIASMGFLIAVTVAALGWVIEVDLRTRLDGQKALYEVRRQVADKFINDGVQFQENKIAAEAAPQLRAAAVTQPALTPIGDVIFRAGVRGDGLKVKMQDETLGTVTGYAQRADSLVVRVLDQNNSIQWPNANDLTIQPTVTRVDLPEQVQPDGQAAGAAIPAGQIPPGGAAAPGAVDPGGQQ